MDIEIDPQAETVIFRSEGKTEHHYRRGDIIGESYQLIDLIGQGGMGVVYRVNHLILGKQYALKLLAPNQINNQSWRRFELEGRSLAKLNHVNIVSIHNMGIDKGCPYFVMDLLSGMSLGDQVKSSGPLSEKENLEVYLQVCAGLSCAHKNGIIHRDIKPGNIMLVPAASGILVKIVDFGMARLQTPSGNASQALTASGEIFGSPYYMSPEQTLGEEMDARSDIYSLGCSLFETLTGRVPFAGTTAIQTLMMHQEAEPPAPSSLLTSSKAASSNETSSNRTSSKLSPAIDAVVARCLKKEASQRYQSAEQLAIDLQRIIDGKPIGNASFDLGSRRLTSSSAELGEDEDEDADVDIEGAGQDHRRHNDNEQAASGFFAQLGQRKLPLALITITALALIGGAALAVSLVVSIRSTKPKEQTIQKDTALAPLSITDDLTDQIPARVKRGDKLFRGLVHKTIKTLKEEDERHEAAGTSNAQDSLLKNSGLNLFQASAAQIKYLNSWPKISDGIHTINGQRMRCFNFPSDLRIARIHSNHTNSRDARGPVMVPEEEKVDLHFDSLLDTCPTLVDKIAPDDISSVRLQNLDSVGAVTTRLSKWSNLHTLTIDGGETTNDDLASFDQIKNLNHLWIKRQTFDWNVFVQLRVLKQLQWLEIEDYKQLNELLQNLPTLPKLENLRLEGKGKNWLTGRSIAALGKHPRLTAIILRDKDQELEQLEASGGTTIVKDSIYHQLPIYDCRYEFAKLTNVKAIYFDKPNWSQEQIAEFLLTVPAARENKWASAFRYHPSQIYR